MFRAAVLTAVLFTLSFAANAQANQSLSQQGSILGSVVTDQNKPVSNARIEVHDLLLGTAISATYTNQAGYFEIDNIGFGTYEIVAISGVTDSREQVRLQTMQATVTLRLYPQRSDDAGSANTVSVSDFKIPKKAREAMQKAEAAVQALKTEEALAHIGIALQIYPRYAAALTLRGIMKLDTHDAQNAASDLEQAIQCDPAYALAYLAFGATYNNLSRFDDSIRTIDRGIALSPTSWQGYYELGKAYIGRGDFTTAIKQLNKAEDMAPKDFALVHLVKAHAMLGMKDYSSAMLELQSYLTRRPQGPDSEAARKTLDDVRSFLARSK